MNKAALELLIQLKDEATKGLQNIGGTLTKLGGLAVAGVAVAGAALVGFGAEAVNVAADFESGVNRFASVTGGSLKEAGISIEDFKGQWLKLGAETQFSAAQAQDAAINLAKGGVAIKDIMGGATSAVLDLAAAGELELGPAAEIVAKQLGVWSDTGTTAAEVANLMAQAANASTVDVDELALGLANVGGVAKGAGVGFNDLVTTMALIAPGFSSAADAGTSLKTMITRLVPSTSDAKGAFAQLGLSTFDTQRALEFLKAKGLTPVSESARDVGIALNNYADAAKMSKKDTQDFFLSFENNNFFDAQGQFLGMENAAKQLNTAMSGLSDIEKTDMLKQIFGDDGARAAIALIEAGGEGLKKMSADMAAAGTAAEQAKVKQQGFNFAMDSLKGSIETVMIVAGGLLLPMLTDLINLALIPGANAVLAFFTQLSAGSTATGGFIGQLELMVPGITNFVTTAQTLFNSLVTWIVANWPQIQATIETVFNTIVSTVLPILTAAFNGLVTLVQTIIAQFVEHWPQIQAAVEAVVNAIAVNVLPVLITAFTGLLDIVKNVVGWVIENWPLIQATVTRVMQAISNIVQVTLPILRGIFETVFPIIKTIVEVAIGAILGIIKVAMQLITGDTKGALETVQDTFSTIWTRIRTALSGVITQIGTIIRNGMATAKADIVRILGEAVAFVESLPGRFLAAGRSLIQSLWDGIAGMGSWFRERFSGFIQDNLPDWAKDIFKGSSFSASQASTFMPDAVKTIRDGASFAPAAAGGVQIIIYATVSNDVDIDDLAYAVARRVQARRSR